MKNNGKYLEIKWQGRAGQGVMTAASILAEVLVMEGRYVQAFPEFNHEENAPFVWAYNRLSDSPIRFHSPVINTDITAIMDPSVILNANLEANGNGNPGAGAIGEANAEPGVNARYIVNTSLHPRLIYEKLDAAGSIVYTVDADTISREEIGETFPNISLLAVLFHCIDWIPIEHFKERLRELSANRWRSRLNFNFASALSKIIERSLREVRKFTGADAAAKNSDANISTNKNTNSD
jgi:2-oxoacid:acceptor oxidoreductase gamma subunit (pyruvate/2-ketoisovalerate family)